MMALGVPRPALPLGKFTASTSVWPEGLRLETRTLCTPTPSRTKPMRATGCVMTAKPSEVTVGVTANSGATLSAVKVMTSGVWERLPTLS